MGVNLYLVFFCAFWGALSTSQNVHHSGKPVGVGAPGRMSATGVRRDKAALSSRCKAHPAIRTRRKQSEQSWR
jgi:hypothetical protein